MNWVCKIWAVGWQILRTGIGDRLQQIYNTSVYKKWSTYVKTYRINYTYREKERQPEGDGDSGPYSLCSQCMTPEGALEDREAGREERTDNSECRR